MSYTITIQADGSDVATTVRVDDSGARPRVTEVSVRASNGLSTPQVPAIDPDLLLRAVSLGPPLRRAAPAPGATAPTQATTKKASGPARTARRAGRKRAATTKAATKTATRTAKAAKAAAASRAATAPKAAAKAARASKVVRDGSRVYRRTPDDLAATFARIANISAVARHYGVPRHTAQGWIARLRQQG